MDINRTVTAIEDFLRGHAGVAETQVRASGDDVDVIKIWIDAGGAADRAWITACEAAITKAVPDAASFRLELHVE